MTPKERFLKRLNGEMVDKIPNFSIVMEFASKYIGSSMDKFCSDYNVLVEANIKTAKDFGLDILNTMSDPVREAADYGSEIIWDYDRIPRTKGSFIETPSDVKKLKPFNPHDSVRMLDRIKAIELYKKETGDNYPIMGWVEGTIAETADLMGLTNLLMAFYDEPEMVKEIMDICLVTAKSCIRAQVEAGADIIGVGDAAASIIGPALYKEYGLFYEQEIFAEIKRCGAVGRLHICGDITCLLDDLAIVGADIIDVDWMVDLKTASDKLKGISTCGNFDPVAVVLNGTEESIIKEVQRCVDEGNNRSIIMAGCEIPPNTSHENFCAIHKALMSCADKKM